MPLNQNPKEETEKKKFFCSFEKKIDFFLFSPQTLGSFASKCENEERENWLPFFPILYWEKKRKSFVTNHDEIFRTREKEKKKFWFKVRNKKQKLMPISFQREKYEIKHTQSESQLLITFSCRTKGDSWHP